MRKRLNNAIFAAGDDFRRGSGLLVAVFQKDQPRGVRLRVQPLQTIEIGGHLLSHKRRARAAGRVRNSRLHSVS